MITISEAEEILKKEYHQDNYIFLLKNILLSDFVKDEHEIEFQSQLFKNVKQLGYSNSCNVTIFEVVLNEGSQNKRVMITQTMFKILRSLRIDNALVSFVNNDKNNYRISLLTSKYEYDGDKIIKIVSNPRRFSYALGFGTKTKTAYKFLVSKGKVNNLSELISRFSVEVVNKQFYSEIAETFTKLIGGKFGNKKYKRILQLKDINEDKKFAEFGVRLIGRILFCWFLREKHSDNGISLIPNYFFDEETIDSSINYYNEVLEPLFFELLNTKQSLRKQEFLNVECDYIPYLNGGLFSPNKDDNYHYDIDRKASMIGNVIIPNEWFVEFYHTLSEYNFTVDENTSYDIELSIDPEMLGRIFENLLAEINPETEENAKKSTGSFYTPRDIVDYMVDSSLVSYLERNTNVNKNALKELVSYTKEDDQYEFNEEEKISIINALYKITVCDPACGSGAFPIGMLQKIVYVLQVLDPTAKMWLNKNTENVDPIFKHEIEKKFSGGSLNYIRKISVIQNSIFGTDIQPIAVEISRLRCFLSLIIEEQVKDDEPNRGINPLPNLDFKFIIANSLIKLEDSTQMSLFENQDNIKALKNVRSEYFVADSSRRNELKLEFANIQQNMLIESLGSYGKNPSKKYYQLSSWKPFANELTEWFDKEWMFGIQEGFDIVIGNPPYIGTGSRNTSTRMSSEEQNYYKTNYPNSAEYKINMYALFMELAIKFCKEGGVLSYIVPDSFLVGKYFSKIRNYILNESSISEILLIKAKVFEAASVGQSVVFLFNKEKINKEMNISLCNTLDEISNRSFITNHYNQSLFRNTYNNAFYMLFSDEAYKLVKKIEANNHNKIKDYIKFRSGLISKEGQDKIKSTIPQSGSWGPGIFSGENVQKYKVEYTGQYLCYEKDIIKSGGIGTVNYFEPKLFVRQTGDSITCAIDFDNLLAINNVHIGNLLTSEENDLYYICALLNSSIIDAYYKIISLEEGRTMAQIDIDTLLNIPAPDDEKLKQEVIDLCKEIYKTGNINLQYRLNKLVEQMYFSTIV